MRGRSAWPGLLCALLLLGQLGAAQGWEMRVCADPDDLPFSNRQMQGFDNRIAELLAKDLGARLTYVWWKRSPSMVHMRLREGHCDLILGLGEGYEGTLSTLAYYQSSFVFVYREDSPYAVASMDDPVLKELRVAVETPGVPPFEALANRGLSAKAVILEATDPAASSPSSPIVEAVAKGQVDVAIVWGPVAGYFARRQPTKLKVVPVQPEFELPAISMVYPVVIGVRAGDEALRDRLNIALVRRWDQIQAILKEYGVPQIPLPKPVLEVKKP